MATTPTAPARAMLLQSCLRHQGLHLRCLRFLRAGVKGDLLDGDEAGRVAGLRQEWRWR